jgi:hypothetical protein
LPCKTRQSTGMRLNDDDALHRPVDDWRGGCSGDC